MFDIRSVQTDSRKKDEGIWKIIGLGDIKVLFRSPQSREYQKIRARLERPYRDKIRKNRMTPEDNKRLLIDSLCEGAILDWQNVWMDEEIEWTIETGKQLLDPNAEPYGNEIFLQHVVDAFLETDGYYRDEFRSSEKNSLTLSAIN